MCRVQICPKPELALKIKQGYKVRYPKYSKHGLYTVAHTINWVCYKILNRGLNPGLLFSLFQVFWMKRHFEWTWKFRIEIQIPVLFNILVLLDVQANLPKTSPYFVCPNAFGENLFSYVGILGMFNFAGRFRKCHKKPTNFGPTPFLQNGVKTFLKKQNKYILPV